MSMMDSTIRGNPRASDPLLIVSSTDGFVYESAPLIGAGGDADFSDALGVSGQLKINTSTDDSLLFEVLDADFLSDELMGELEISVEALCGESGANSGTSISSTHELTIDGELTGQLTFDYLCTSE